MKKTIRFLITGVGGQGTILASDILAEVGLRLGHDAKKSDILGLAVRGAPWSATSSGAKTSARP